MSRLEKWAKNPPTVENDPRQNRITVQLDTVSVENLLLLVKKTGMKKGTILNAIVRMALQDAIDTMNGT